MKIYKWLDEIKFAPTCPPSTGKIEIFETLDEPNDKGEVYVKVREINSQALINSAAKNTDLSIIIKKFLATGDNSLLEKSQGVYMDTSKLPTDIISMNNYHKTIEDYFNKNSYLKAVYNNNFEEYFKDYTNGFESVSKKMSIYNEKVIKDLEKSKNENIVKEKENEIK